MFLSRVGEETLCKAVLSPPRTSITVVSQFISLSLLGHQGCSPLGSFVETLSRPRVQQLAAAGVAPAFFNRLASQE